MTDQQFKKIEKHFEVSAALELRKHDLEKHAKGSIDCMKLVALLFNGETVSANPETIFNALVQEHELVEKVLKANRDELVAEFGIGVDRRFSYAKEIKAEIDNTNLAISRLNKHISNLSDPGSNFESYVKVGPNEHQTEKIDRIVYAQTLRSQLHKYYTKQSELLMKFQDI